MKNLKIKKKNSDVVELQFHTLVIRPKLEAERALTDSQGEMSLEVLSKQNPCQRSELIGENPCACNSERAWVDCRNGFL